MTLIQVAVAGALGLASLACGLESSPPTQPTPAATEPRPDPPPPVPPGARRIEVGVATSDELTNYPPPPAGCPPLGLATYPDAMMPCRHFEVLAPGDGILRVEVSWRPADGAEGLELIVAGVTQDNRLIWYAPVGTHRVLARAAYGITVVYDPTHYDYVVQGPNRIGEFTIKVTFEPRRWL